MTGTLKPGDHLASPRAGYTHHGIYVGEGRVIHYLGLEQDIFKDPKGALQKAPISETRLEDFELGRGYYIKDHENRLYTPSQTVERARSRLGEDEYSLTFNNCEHFCHWCLYGQQKSSQVRRAVTAIGSVCLAFMGAAMMYIGRAQRARNGE
jgi:hypothetical protein